VKYPLLGQIGLCCTFIIGQALSASGQDTVSFNALEPLLNETSSQVWVQCVNEGSDCTPGTSALVTTRYGVDGSYFFYFTENVEKVPCKNSVNGDPKQGSDKTCQYTTENVFGLPGSGATWTKASDEGDTFTHSASGYFWMRYGTGGHYVYSLLEGGNVQKVECSNDYFGIDPIKEDKACYVGPAYAQGIDGFSECAKEDQTCLPNASTTIIARYGTQEGWDTRFYRSSDGSYPCSNTFFGYDPIKADKSCYFQEIKPVSVATEGQWQEVGSCSGNSCASLTKSITFGTSKTSQWSTSTQWGVTVTESMEVSFEILGVGAKVTPSVATSFSDSLGFQEALTTSQSETLTATCDLAGSTTGLMYQFRTDTQSTCVEDGTCTGNTLTADYACIGDPPVGYSGPQCVPGYCADALCTVCNY
jgi:hypothetical protein